MGRKGWVAWAWRATAAVVVAGAVVAAYLLGRAAGEPAYPAPLRWPAPGDTAQAGYPQADLEKVAHGHWRGPRAELTGVVAPTRAEADGNWHFRLEGGGPGVFCEIIPELPMPHPMSGQRIKVQGIVRFDRKRDCWEIHPVVHWEEVKPPPGGPPPGAAHLQAGGPGCAFGAGGLTNVNCVFSGTYSANLTAYFIKAPSGVTGKFIYTDNHNDTSSAVMVGATEWDVKS